LLDLILSPARPLWPARRILGWFSEKLPANQLMTRAQKVYDVYGHRNDAFEGLRTQIPDSVPIIGVIDDSDDMESSLWRPFGKRAVVYLADVEHGKPANIEWVVVKTSLVTNQFRSFEEWTHTIGGTLVSRQMLSPKAQRGPEEWSLLRFTGTAESRAPRIGELASPAAQSLPN
jgi:hypothetical protein